MSAIKSEGDYAHRVEILETAKRLLELVIPPTKRPGSVVVTRPASHGEVPGSNPGLVVLFSLTALMQ